MSSNEYTLRIDAFTPDTLPMARLAEYLAAFADLVGCQHSTHFDRLEEGSARLVGRVDEVDAPKVATRLADVAAGNPPSAARKAFKRIDELLAADNAVGELINPDGRVIIPFPGRMRPQSLTFPAFRQDGSIDGVIVNIGGRDATAHIILENGKVSYTNIDLKRSVARELAHHLYGPKIRLFGSGRWERHPDGAWKLLGFTVDRYEVLDEASLGDVLADLRAVTTPVSTHYATLIELRGGDEDVH